MKLHITYCSKNKKKTEKDIPAIERYDSNRIKRVRSISKEDDEDFAILSGKYGLIPPEKIIPEYDKLLTKEDIEKLLPKTRDYLKTKEPEKVIYHTKKVERKRKPYFTLIKETCKAEKIELEKKLISQNT